MSASLAKEIVVTALRKIYETLRAANQLLSKYHYTAPSMEIVYRSLLVRDLARFGIPDTFYPVSGAANHSLLYLVLRCISELEIGQAIECGAGQTSLLISRFNQTRTTPIPIRTVEHDADWATRIGAQVSHPVVVAPLVEKTIRGHRIQHYAPPYFDPAIRYDFVLVDGPPAFNRQIAHNRIGVVELIDHNLAPDFVIIVDDAERRGETALVEAIRETLTARSVDFLESRVTAAKTQHLFSAGNHRAAAYF